jgi:isoquinoline 1-oxidoreductase alpha subunit
MPRLNVNGIVRDIEVEDDMPLLWALREEYGLTGTKFGCGAGLCGACTVMIDGVAARSCQVAVSDVGSRTVTTIEGLSADRSHPVQAAWVALQVPQCGYCQSGMIMAAAALLKVTPDPTDEQINEAVSNICRCGTYSRVRSAIHRVANAGSGGAI